MNSSKVPKNCPKLRNMINFAVRAHCAEVFRTVRSRARGEILCGDFAALEKPSETFKLIRAKDNFQSLKV